MADSGDTGLPCGAVQGSGCDRLASSAPVEQVDCDTSQETLSAGEVDGDVYGGSCEGGGGFAVVLLALGVLLRRRRTQWIVLSLLLLCPLPAWAVDAQTLRPLDGGPYVALREAETGADWSPAVALTSTWTQESVVFIDENGNRTPLLGQVWTTELGVSFKISSYARIGVAVPWHARIVFNDTDKEPELGDVRLWVTIPIRDRDGWKIAWSTQTDFATGPTRFFLGNSGGSVAGVLAVEKDLPGPWVAVGNLGLRLAQVETLPGVDWGNRYEYGAGVHGELWGPFAASVELWGSTPSRKGSGEVRSAASYPVEVLGSAQVFLPLDLALSVGAGTGLSRGLGAPSVRAVASLDYKSRERPDADHDGIIDTRDACPNTPEDRDGWQDTDGCPEADNDHDGLIDREDTCPDDAEVFNAYQDWDGCPDRLTELMLTVVSQEPELLEQARFQVGELDASGILPDDPTPVPVPQGEFTVHVSAEGHHPHNEVLWILDVEVQEHTVVLEPIRYGDAHVLLVTPDGDPIEGWARGPDGPVPVGVDGGTVHLLTGPQTLTVYAAQHQARAVEVEIGPGQVTHVRVELAASPVHLDERRIVLEDEVAFELDSAVLLPDGTDVLDQVAALMLSTPDLELVRVEGHADETGNSRHNLVLSQDRAQAVVDYLVDQGVERERLQPLGTGEAQPLADGDTASRRVEFLVLVWADGQGQAPALELSPAAP